MLKQSLNYSIKPFNPLMLDDIVSLSLRAWEPVLESIRIEMGDEVFFTQNPDWKKSQKEAVIEACENNNHNVLAVTVNSKTVGFAALKLHLNEKIGEIYMIAVAPEFQRNKIAKTLTEYALDWFKDSGMTTAMVETGGDSGHAPARNTYTSAGFEPFPIMRYFRKL